MTFFQISNTHLYIAILLSVLNAWLLLKFSLKFLQVIQQSGYKIGRYIAWAKTTRYKHITSLAILGAVSFLFALVFNILLDSIQINSMFSYFGLICYMVFSVRFCFKIKRQQNKLPLVKTKRVWRWVVVLGVLYFTSSLCLIAVLTEYVSVVRFGVIAALPIFVPFFVVVGFYLVLPLEVLIGKSYIRKAKKTLAKYKSLKIVAITGSYGKTSNKFILKEMLGTQFSVVASPSSFNTPLGLTRTILNDLKPHHEFFIAEFGAKKQGEIKELCKMIKPHHGLITAVGSQHLETFKKLETIKKTKFELAEYIKEGCFGFNGNNQTAKELFINYENKNKFLTFSKDESGFAYCKEIKPSYSGTSFVLIVDGKKIKASTKLLGEFNLENIALCAGLAFKLGVSLKNIKKAIENLQPIKHRMQIVSEDKNYVVIDDSFNASVEGAKAAVETLSLFEGYTKIVITPGIVEMGKLDNDANFGFGKQIAKVCNFAIVVNQTNKHALMQGMIGGGMDKQNILFCNTLKEATEKIADLKAEKTVVLFENDLPDLFV